jgi:hypothetical protein
MGWLQDCQAADDDDENRGSKRKLVSEEEVQHGYDFILAKKGNGLIKFSATTLDQNSIKRSSQPSIPLCKKGCPRGAQEANLPGIQQDYPLTLWDMAPSIRPAMMKIIA